MRQFAIHAFSPYLHKSGTGLELGCSDGQMTESLAEKIDALDVVDGSTAFLQEASARGLKNVNFFDSLFEEFKPAKKYDFVFASYILEHVLDPQLIFKVVKEALKPDGLFFVVVPNSRALSRQLALHMGLIQDLKALTNNDLAHGHRRVYDRVALNRDLEVGGFQNVSQGGIMLKILADFQMDQLIDNKMLQQDHLNGLYKLGLEYPDLCGSLFSICRPS